MFTLRSSRAGTRPSKLGDLGWRSTRRCARDTGLTPSVPPVLLLTQRVLEGCSRVSPSPGSVLSYGAPGLGAKSTHFDRAEGADCPLKGIR